MANYNYKWITGNYGEVSYRTGANKAASKIKTHINRPLSYGPAPTTKSGMLREGFGVVKFGDWEEFKQFIGLGYYKSDAMEIDRSYGVKSSFTTGLYGYKTYDIELWQDKIDKALNVAAKRCVDFLIRAIKKGIREGQPVGGDKLQPISSATYELRRAKAKERGEKAKAWVGAKSTGYFKGAKPLMRTGDYYRSIKGIVLPKGSFFVGVPKGSRNREGQDLTVIAAVHESGMVLRVNKELANWFAAQGVPLRDKTTHLIIPRRSVMQPVLQSQKALIKRIYQEEINTFLFDVKGYSAKAKKSYLKRRVATKEMISDVFDTGSW